MPTVLDVIQSLLPSGSVLPKTGDRPTWRTCPTWPPDVFAVAATLAVKSGCYAESCYAPVDQRARFFSDTLCERIKQDGREWRSRGMIPRRVRSAWQLLWSHRTHEVTDRRNLPRPCKDAVMTLLTIADEAAAGMGFFGNTLDSQLVQALIDNYARKLMGEEIPLRHLFKSICWLVPPTRRACSRRP